MIGKRSITMVALALSIASCVTQPSRQSIDELMALRDKRVAAANRNYPGVSEKEAMEAIVKVFKHLDESDVKFDIRESKLLVSRLWTYYAVFVVGFGNDYWEFKFKHSDNGTTISAAFDTDSNHGPFASQVGTAFKENIEVGGGRVTGASADDLQMLHDRVEYFLNKRSEWPTCNAYKAMAVETGRAMVLCDMIGIEDRVPASAPK